ncbi:hypothetical protein IEQ34_016076 [Dendrobium chrysotoxum]|uniref:Uncharacterized protein n=1 Tax=Dendrobium chrysotoxum TaxID=161865 RepID=A0AAV7GDC6_DENCH|nr:hypothetical protein IEQ34_016076 [Dendrobium chrysotoxum]
MLQGSIQQGRGVVWEGVGVGRFDPVEEADGKGDVQSILVEAMWMPLPLLVLFKIEIAPGLLPRFQMQACDRWGPSRV